MSTFDFTWNSDSKTPKGKVFARKRKAANKESKTPDKPSLLTDINKNHSNRNYSTPLQVKNNPESKIKTNLKSKNSASLNKKGNETVKTSKLLVNTKKNTPFTPKFQEKSFDDSTKLVKRKRKKDKAAAKTITKDDSADEPNQNQVSQTMQRSQTHSLFAVGYKDVYVNTNIKGKSIVEKVFSSGKKFGDLDIHRYLVSNLEKINFTSLTNVQEKSIPEIMSGKNVLVSELANK